MTWPAAPRNRRPVVVAIAASVLAHVVLIGMLVRHHRVTSTSTASSNGDTLSVPALVTSPLLHCADADRNERALLQRLKRAVDHPHDGDARQLGIESVGAVKVLPVDRDSLCRIGARMVNRYDGRADNIAWPVHVFQIGEHLLVSDAAADQSGSQRVFVMRPSMAGIRGMVQWRVR